MKPITMQGQQSAMNMPQQQPQHPAHRKIIYQQGPPSAPSQPQPTQQSANQPYHPSYHRMHHPQAAPQAGPPSAPAPQPAAPGPSRLLDLFDALKQEFDAVSESVNVYKVQKDEYEHKLNAQIHEISLIQQNLYELERTHQRIKANYEEEISRLKRELERLGGRYDGYYPSTNGEQHVAKRMRAEEPQSNQPGYYSGQPGYGKDPRGYPAGSGVPHQGMNHAMHPQPSQQRPNPMGHYPGNPPAASNYPSQGTNPAAQPATPAQPAATANQPTASPPAVEERITGVCDLDPDQVGPGWRKDGSDWVVTYNPRSSVLQHDRFDVNLLSNLDHDSVVCVVRFSPCGKFLATGCNHYTTVYDVENGSKMSTLFEERVEQKDLYIRAVCFSPDSSLLATGAEDRVIRLWDVATQTIKVKLTGHEQDIYSLDWSKDGRFLFSGSGDRTIRVWDVEKGSCMRVVANDADEMKDDMKDAGVTSLSLNPNYPRCLAAGSLDRVVRIWDIATGRLLERFEGHRDSVYSVAFSPDGMSLVSGSLDKTVRVWDLSTSTLNYFATSAAGLLEESRGSAPGSPAPRATITTAARHVLSGHKDFVLSVAYAGLNAQIGRVDENGDPVATPGGDALAEVEWIVSGSKDRTVTFWDGGRGAKSGMEPPAVAQFTLQGHRNSVISVALAPVGGLFATGSGDHRVRVWRVSADRDGMVSLPPAGPTHHSQTSSQTSMAPAYGKAFPVASEMAVDKEVKEENEEEQEEEEK